MNPCRETRHVQDYLDGELAPERARAFEAHLQACARCAPEVRAYQALFASLRADRVEDPGPRLTERILDRVVPSRLRRRWVSALGWAYGTASAVSTFAFVSWIVQPSTHVWLAQRFSEASLRVMQTLLFSFQVLTRSWLDVLDGWAFMETLAGRVAPIARAVTWPLWDPRVAAITLAAVLTCTGVLWWMRPRRGAVTEEVRHVSLLGF